MGLLLLNNRMTKVNNDEQITLTNNRFKIEMTCNPSVFNWNPKNKAKNRKENMKDLERKNCFINNHLLCLFYACFLINCSFFIAG